MKLKGKNITPKIGVNGVSEVTGFIGSRIIFQIFFLSFNDSAIELKSKRFPCILFHKVLTHTKKEPGKQDRMNL